jgi:hypothetical protein
VDDASLVALAVLDPMTKSFPPEPVDLFKKDGSFIIDTLCEIESIHQKFE